MSDVWATLAMAKLVKEKQPNQVARARGVTEAEFAARIHALFTQPNTCVIGYNNVRFDDEVTRNIFYRNFFDPYGWSWQNGNSRWDLASEFTFLFHDYETFGKSPSLDRPAQFAGLRTDADFNPVGEPQVFYCQPADDYLPQPEAVMITGITPVLSLKMNLPPHVVRQIAL
ncbi:hypothetical protein CRX72_21590 [Pantoea sp. BRM17]|nr:hypothetical protein CRX72_21590 [Pantoea sp. BRM17]